MTHTALRDTILSVGGNPTGSTPIYVTAGSDMLTHSYTLPRNREVCGENIVELDPHYLDCINPRRWRFMQVSGCPRKYGGQREA